MRPFRHSRRGGCAPSQPARNDAPALICRHCLDALDGPNVADHPAPADGAQSSRACSTLGRGPGPNARHVRRLWQKRDVGNLSIRHSCERTRSHARGLNPLARGHLISPGANFPLRQTCARVRGRNTPAASQPLTATSFTNQSTVSKTSPAYSTGNTHLRSPWCSHQEQSSTTAWNSIATLPDSQWIHASLPREPVLAPLKC